MLLSTFRSADDMVAGREHGMPDWNAQTTSEKIQPMGEQAKTVLIVDDEPQLCLLIGEELRACGFDCHTISDPEEARDLLGIQHYDVLITDIAMPNVSGLDLLVLAQQNAPACKVILITGTSSREYLAQALMVGAYDYVEKPFSTDELLGSVQRAINDRGDVFHLPMRAAAAMELSEQATQAAFDSIQALVKAVEAKDPYTRQHSEHVAHYAVALAATVGATAELQETVRIAALLHDVGKIGVPDHILTKPGKLTDDEFEHIRRHPALGSDILSNITLFKHVPMIVRHHHERWEGGGYPDGLAGEEIPWAARLINVADSMDAMLLERTYKSAYDVGKMMNQLRICAGKQFDPAIAAAALAWCEKNMDQLILPNRPIETLVA